MTDLPRLGVVLVTHGSGDVVGDCLDTLLASRGVALSVVVVDNASSDDTAAVVAARSAPAPHDLRWCPTGRNGGFAAGVNHGLDLLLPDPGLDRFWILNPDTLVPAGTARAFAAHPAPGGFGLIGGRVVYADPPGRIQIDGGVIDWRTGRTFNIHQNAPADTAPPRAAEIDFVTGASMVVSRAFVEKAGPMPEAYFLYYEEVDWALRRGALPLLHCAEAVVRHRAGTAIGSGRPGRTASPFSEWFKHRARLRFVRRHRPAALPGAWAFTAAKAAQLLLLRRDPAAAAAVMRGGFGLAPPAAVRRRLESSGADLLLG